MSFRLSASQVEMFLRCQVSWKFAYIDRIKREANGPMLRGTALDQAATAYYQAKAKATDMPNRVVFVSTAGDFYENQTFYKELDQPLADGRRMVEKAAGAYFDNIATKFSAKSADDVQKKVSGSVGDVSVIGFVDLLTDAGVVIDTKLKERMPSQGDVDRSLQLTTYAWLTGARTLALGVATPAGKAQMIWTERTDEDVERVKALYTRVAEVMDGGSFAPADPTSWACSPKWCSFWSLCQFGGGAVR